jgi:hypothetical protein
MHLSRALSLAVALLAALVVVSPLDGLVSFPAPELLGRPTSDSVTVNVVASAAIEAYFEYGTTPGVYTNQTAIQAAPANEPLIALIDQLEPDTQYFYRMQYREAGTLPWIARDEHAFHTARPAGRTFTFTMTSDSHVNVVFGNATLWQRTLLNIQDDHPDFHLDLGDTFAMDNVTTQAGARTAYLTQRPYMGLMSHSTPIFLVLGNHEQEEGWHRDDTGNLATSKPILGAMARKRYFLNPTPNAFYSGNTDAWPVLGGDQLPADYYAWEWGDALFIAIDPYWYTTTKPFVGNLGGGEGSDPGSGDRWDWTLGRTQYDWLKQVLETSHAKYKFMFAHHGTGGTDDYIRGGANAVPFNEWGGYNENGTTWAFDARRPGWFAPIHQLLVQNHLTAFFHGHDHEYAHEQRDGVVYQAMPMGAESGYGFGFQEYRETDPYAIRVLPNSGHLRVTVSPASATVEYVRSFLPGDGVNGQVADTYSLSGWSGTPNTAPSVATPATATPSPVAGTTTNLTVLGADDAGEAALTYTWATTGVPPAAVTFSANGTNAAKNAIVTFTKEGSYTFQVTIRDAGNLTVTSNVSVTVTPAAPPVAVAYVQGAGATNQASATSIARAFTTSNTAGNLIVVAVTWDGSASMSCADSQLNAYALATTQYDGTNNQTLAICYAANIKAGANTVTATFGASSSWRRMLIHEYRGLALTSPVDVVAKNVASGTTGADAITSTAAVTTVSGDLIFGAVMDDANPTTITAGTGFTQRQALNSTDLATEDLVQTTAGSIAATHTFGAANRYLALMVAFKPGGPPNAAPTVATPAAASPSPVAGATTNLTALGADDGGEAGLTYTWATTGTPPAAVTFGVNGTNAAKNTLATFTKAGSYTLQVTIRDAANLTVMSNVGVTVTQTLTTISVTPASAAVPTNATQAFSATARDQFATLLSPQPAFSWSVDAGGTIDSTGLFTAGASPGGPFTVTATSGPVTGTATLSVTPVNVAPTVASAAAATPSPATATTTSLSVMGADDAGETGLTYTWTTTGTPPAPVTFTASGTNAAKSTLATFTRAGNYTFQVTIRDAGNLTVTSTIGVTVAQTVTTIVVTPPTATVVTGGTQAFTAGAADQFGQAMASPPAFTWSVSGGGTINATGQFTAGATAGGPFTVTASSAGKSGNASVTVTAPSAGIAYVQGASVTFPGSDYATSIARAFTSANTAGNLIAVAVSWDGTATVSCADTQGNAYVVAITRFDSTNRQSLAVCYAANVTAGANTVTATFSGASSWRRMLIHEYRGVALVNPVDVVAGNVANGTTAANAITSTVGVTTVAGDLIFGTFMDDGGVNNSAAGTGFMLRQSVNNRDLISEDLVQAAAGAIAATATFSAAHRYLGLLVAFKRQ